MKIALKTIALFLAIGAMAQSIYSYANEIENLPQLIHEQEEVLMDLLSGNTNAVPLAEGTESPVSDAERQKLIIKNMVHYIRLIEGQKTLLEELKKQNYPDLNVRMILEGRSEPGI
ncbi:MAG: hypothetical protein KDD50_14545 [Bdellovibrionales bacterium]|nr:hypothetical protein [Bdellovibrionales bacterium]